MGQMTVAFGTSVGLGHQDYLKAWCLIDRLGLLGHRQVRLIKPVKLIPLRLETLRAGSDHLVLDSSFTTILSTWSLMIVIMQNNDKC